MFKRNNDFEEIVVGQGMLEDVLKEILVCLPVKSLLRLRCASKFWWMLIKSPFFVNCHIIKQRRNDSVLLVRHYLPPPEYCDVLSFHDLDSPDLELALPNLSIPFLWEPEKRNDGSFLYREVKLLGPCNGIVCIVYEDIVILSNPGLREFRRLPRCPIFCPPDCFSIPSGRGFGSTCANNFKVVLINEFHSRGLDTNILDVVIHLYNSINDSWREINDYAIVMPCIYSYRCSEIFFRGACHWNGRTTGPTTPDVVLTFDVSTEVFGQFEHPSGLKLCTGLQHCLMVLTGCLASVRCELVRSFVEVWVMKEYGIKESWTKQFVIGPHQIICPFLIWKNNDQLLGEGSIGQLESFGLQTNDAKTFQIYGTFWTLWASVYKESLISIKQVN